jgi:hypothetical protein
MYKQLDNEKPCIGGIKGLNLVAIRCATIQVTNCCFIVVRKLMNNLLQKPALIDVLYISCIKIVHCSKVTKHVWCP